MEKNIYIVRHCQAEGQSPEAALTDKGLLQAKELAGFFRDIKTDRIVSSPFQRAIQSIEPVAEEKKLVIEEDSRLSERLLSTGNMPDWLDKLQATYIDFELAYPGGESSKEAMKRIIRAVEDAAAGFENTLIVTHGNIMSLLLHYYDKRFGFAEWKKLSNPDVFLLKSGHVERLWERGNQSL